MRKLRRALTERETGIKFFRVFSIFFVSTLVWFFVPTPVGLSDQAWHMLIIFVATMIGIMLEVFPLCGFLFVSLLIASMTKTIDLKTQGFSGFSNVVPWLLFLVLALSKSLTNSTIGLRIAYYFMRIFGKNIIGLAYSISITETILSSILPSNTARAASVGFPIVTSLSEYIGSNVKNVSSKAVGSFLTLVYTSANSLCSGMFLTAMISNAVIAEIALQHQVNLTWLNWAKMTIIPCLILLALVPLVLFILTPPKVKNLEGIQHTASEKSKEMGPLSDHEKRVIFVFAFMLIMWILADFIQISIMTTTLLGLCVFLMIGAFSVKDVLSDHSALSSVIMLGVLISYVNNLISFGVIDWFNDIIKPVFDFIPGFLHIYVLGIMYFLTHYFFSGEGTRIIALYLPFVTTGLALGIDKIQLIATLAVFSAFSDMLAHYTCPVSILMFTNGYVSVKKWMSIGIILSVIVIGIWFTYSSIELAIRRF